MLSVKAKEEADTIFKVFDIIQLRIKSSLHVLQTNALTTRPRNWQKIVCNLSLDRFYFCWNSKMNFV